MKKLIIFPLALLLITAFSCKEVKKETENASKEVEETVKTMVKEVQVESITFQMEPKNDSGIAGEVNFTEENGEVKMMASLSGLTEGEHAIHIHEKADCSSADGKSTGGHWNPTFQPHAKWGAEEGYHKGCLLYTSPSPRDRTRSRMPSSA